MCHGVDGAMGSDAGKEKLTRGVRKEFTRPRNKPFPVDAARALHGVRLPRAALPVRHDGRVDTADADVVERGVQARARYVVVGRPSVEHAVENERVRLRR